MTQDPLTLYKLITLYMLDRVTFPLTKAQIGDFILGRDYTNFLTLQQVIAELIDAELIQAKSLRNRTYLEITMEGKDTLAYFGNRIGDPIKEDIAAFFADHEMDMRRVRRPGGLLQIHLRGIRGPSCRKRKGRDSGGYHPVRPR